MAALRVAVLFPDMARVVNITDENCDRILAHDNLTTGVLRHTFLYVTVPLSLAVPVNASRPRGR